MKLSIVIVNYNVKYFLEQCLLSVRESIIDLELEVFVVDNNSTDGSLDYLKPKFPEVIFIANTDNPGFSKANNQAIKIATGDYILLLNPDTVLGENVLSKVCTFMNEHPESGATGVKMIDGAGRFLRESRRAFPTPWVSFCKVSGLTALFPTSKIFGRYHLYFLDKDKIQEIDVLGGAFMMLRKKAIDKVGMLDETFFMYGEDIDLSYRIVKGGYKNYYLPEPIIHYKGESTKDDMRYVRIFYEAMYIFFKKHFPHYSAPYSFFITLGITARGALAAAKRLFIRKEKLKKKYSSTLFDHGKMSYEDIISEIDRSKNKNVQYLIYTPQSNMTIGSQLTFEGKKTHVS